VPETSASEVEFPIGKLKRYTSPDVDHIPAELDEADGKTLRSGIHKLITSIWNKEELPHEPKGSTVVPIHRKGDKLIVVIIEAIIAVNYIKILSNILLCKLTPYADEIIKDHQCGF
jgi:hypothetical protein